MTSEATFLGIPAELRLMIYAEVIAVQTRQMAPLSASKPTRLGPCRNAWALTEVSKQIRGEILPLMPKFSELYFEMIRSRKESPDEMLLMDRWEQTDTYRKLGRAKRVTLTFIDEIGQHSNCGKHGCQICATRTTFNRSLNNMVVYGSPVQSSQWRARIAIFLLRVRDTHGRCMALYTRSMSYIAVQAFAMVLTALTAATSGGRAAKKLGYFPWAHYLWIRSIAHNPAGRSARVGEPYQGSMSHDGRMAGRTGSIPVLDVGERL